MLRNGGAIDNYRLRDRHHRGGCLRGDPLHRGDRRLDRQRADEHHHQSVEHQRLGQPALGFAPRAGASAATRGISGDAGGVTVEAAFAVASLAVVLVLGVGGLTAVGMQVRCVDSSREAARLASRGDNAAASDAARRAGPAGAVLQLRRDGAFVVARVSARSPLFPGLTIAAESVAAVEPGL